MRHKTPVTLGLLFLILACAVSPVQAAPIPLIDGDGHDSGWTVESGGATLDLLPSNIIDVDLDPAVKTVSITVTKDFGPYEDLLGSIVFPVGSLTFREVNANDDLIDKIIIRSESAVNNTGVAWDSFSWKLTPTGAAEFNIGESSGWDEPSFSSWPLTSHQVLASIGIVLNGATFAPSSNLVIDIHPDSSDDPLAITLKQHVTPEPATVALLVVGGLAVLSRRFRMR
jgi:hypothetical protein